MYRTCQPLILASSSPRRQQFFRDLGLESVVYVPQIDEVPGFGEKPQEFVRRMAREKGCAAAEKFPASWVVSADTVVSMGDRILGKPRDAADAVSMLMLLSGQEHQVQTGFCLACMEKNVMVDRVVCTRVVLRQFTEEVARNYVETREPLDKAGAYGIQDRGAFLVSTIAGSYSNVVGLPLAELVELLEEYRVITVQVCV